MGVQTVAINGDIGVALVVDLDGTLCRTDTLHEAILALLARTPGKLLGLPFWLREGRAGLKAQIADRHISDPDILPLNSEVLETVRAARAEGRRTALVSAADHRQVTAVAEKTGLFDEAYGSAEGRNLKGAEKAAFLEQHFGAGQFDYIGDSSADLPVWSAARHAYTVQASPRMIRSAEAVNPQITHLDPPQGQAKAVLRAIRPHQWSKNVLLFLPMLAAHDTSHLTALIFGFLAFCLTASAVYVVNDLIDLASDRAHPRKRKRPFAAGELSAMTGLVLAGGLLLAGLFFALLTGSAGFLATLGAYLVATFLYSLWLKRRLLVDVLMLAGLYTMRMIAGGFAANVEISPWMLGFSMFLFLSLAAVKRQAELMDQLSSGREKSGRAYEIDDLPILRGIALTAANVATLVMALYISSEDVQRLYGRPEILWLLCPLILYWALRMVLKAHRGLMTDDPIVFAARDRVSQLVVAISGTIVLFSAL